MRMSKLLLCMSVIQLIAAASSDFAFERKLQGDGDSGRRRRGENGGSGRRRGGHHDDANSGSARRRNGNREDAAMGSADGNSTTSELTNVTSMIGTDASQALASNSRADMGVTQMQGRSEAEDAGTPEEDHGMSIFPLVPVVAAGGSVLGVCLCVGVWILFRRKGAQKAETACSTGRYVEAVEPTSTFVVGNPVTGDIENQEKAADGEPCKKQALA